MMQKFAFTRRDKLPMIPPYSFLPCLCSAANRFLASLVFSLSSFHISHRFLFSLRWPWRRQRRFFSMDSERAALIRRSMKLLSGLKAVTPVTMQRRELRGAGMIRQAPMEADLLSSLEKMATSVPQSTRRGTILLNFRITGEVTTMQSPIVASWN